MTFDPNAVSTSYTFTLPAGDAIGQRQVGNQVVSAHYTCKPGYQLASTTINTCSTYWTPAWTFTEMPCVPMPGSFFFVGFLLQTENWMYCLVNGGWSDWGACSNSQSPPSCETYGSRSRTCTNPAPANGGTQCSGSAIDTDACFTVCPSKSSTGML
jgi:hypothetical protein